MTRRNQRREHDHAGESGKAVARESQLAFPAGSLFDQQHLATNGNDSALIENRAGLAREHSTLPAQGKSTTSQRAAEKLLPRYGSKLRRIYDHIVAAGAAGRTRQEISDELRIPLQTVCSAVNRLYTMGEKGGKEFGAGIGSNPGHEREDREVLVAAIHVLRWRRS